MNKGILYTVLLTTIVGLVVCCKSSKRGDIFNGEIRYFDDSRKVVKDVTSKPVTMDDGIPAGMIAVHDSLLICWHPNRDNFFNIINLDTGKEIGSFCRKGRGPEEVISFGPIKQFFKKDDNLCTFLWDYNGGRLFLWNISRSVERGSTVYDTIIPYAKNMYFFLFYQPEDMLFVNRPASIPNDDPNSEEVVLPFYEKRSISTKEVIQDYRIYKEKSLREQDVVGLESFFYTWDVIKPDGLKIAQVMKWLPQVNVLDTRTGDVVGYRVKDGPDFSLLEKDPFVRPADLYYFSVHADDNYIYATYWGKERWDDRIGNIIPSFNTIHVFDWSGEQLYEFVTDRSFQRVWLDRVRNRLYTIDPNSDEVYYLDLGELSV
jgi:hypothetical protein